MESLSKLFSSLAALAWPALFALLIFKFAEPLKKLIDDLVELGGRIWVCGPCIKVRDIEEADLIDGARVTAAAQVNIAAMEANAVFTY